MEVVGAPSTLRQQALKGIRQRVQSEAAQSELKAQDCYRKTLNTFRPGIFELK
jgi:hypothetical protein|tara:strand:+ start:252 stop:410 length:159 start_codon:yes stop_codon:yes gene_type:complete